jgi:two-component system response regulator AtoC
VKKGLFREDLYYRLQVVAINLPPLRERGDDVFVLTDHFINVFSKRYGRMIGLDADAREIFRTYSWPGNVRELENLIERFFVLEDSDLIGARHLPARITREVEKPASLAITSAPPVDPPPPASNGTFWERTDAYQRELIVDALRRAHYRLERAASILGLSRHALRHQIKRLGVTAGAD